MSEQTGAGNGGLSAEAQALACAQGPRCERESVRTSVQDVQASGRLVRVSGNVTSLKLSRESETAAWKETRHESGAVWTLDVDNGKYDAPRGLWSDSGALWNDPSALRVMTLAAMRHVGTDETQLARVTAHLENPSLLGVRSESDRTAAFLSVARNPALSLLHPLHWRQELAGKSRRRLGALQRRVWGSGHARAFRDALMKDEQAGAAMTLLRCALSPAQAERAVRAGQGRWADGGALRPIDTRHGLTSVPVTSVARWQAFGLRALAGVFGEDRFVRMIRGEHDLWQLSALGFRTLRLLEEALIGLPGTYTLERGVTGTLAGLHDRLARDVTALKDDEALGTLEHEMTADVDGVRFRPVTGSRELGLVANLLRCCAAQYIQEAARGEVHFVTGWQGETPWALLGVRDGKVFEIRTVGDRQPDNAQRRVLRTYLRQVGMSAPDRYVKPLEKQAGNPLFPPE